MNYELEMDKMQKDQDEMIVTKIIEDSDEHLERLKSCLIALRMASIPLDLLTASALHELSVRMGINIESMES